MKILITGARGMLGRELAAYLPQCGHELILAGRAELDITDAGQCRKVITDTSPQLLINCAAMTAVDACETEIEKAYLLNEAAPANLARACHDSGCTMIQISTDYVFDGKKDSPYTETDATAPQTVYGASKLAGEKAVAANCDDYIIARVAWLYGSSGPSFLHTMLKLSKAGHPQLKVVNDQTGNPTSCNAVAAGLEKLIRNNCRGLFHLTCEGEATWYDFTREIFKLAGVSQKVVPCSSEEYPRPARRPKNSRLENSGLKAAGLPAQPDWREALNDFFNSCGEELK